MAPALAAAQTANPAETAKIHLGPVGVTPGITVSSGVDSNVFAQEADPKSDMVMVDQPSRAVVVSRAAAHRRSPEHRRRGDVHALPESERIRHEQRSPRRSAAEPRPPAGHCSFLSTPQRANFEIDTRARRHTTTFSLGADIKASSKTYLRFTGSRSSTDFDDEAFNEGVNLSQSLDRRIGVVSAAWRYQVTGATTLAMSADVTREEFVYSSEKDSTSFRFAPGVEFDSRAIISGRAYVGYRRFTITSGLAPTFTGPVASVELSSTVREATRLGVQVGRDVAYSFDITTPVRPPWRPRRYRRSPRRAALGFQRERVTPEPALRGWSADGGSRARARETHGSRVHLRRNVDVSAQ